MYICIMYKYIQQPKWDHGHVMHPDVNISGNYFDVALTILQYGLNLYLLYDCMPRRNRRYFFFI